MLENDLHLSDKSADVAQKINQYRRLSKSREENLFRAVCNMDDNLGFNFECCT